MNPKNSIKAGLLLFLALTLSASYGWGKLLENNQNMNTPKEYHYLDGSGNSYLISCEEQFFIEYDPIKPKESCSGIYDGGEYEKKDISLEALDTITQLIFSAKDNIESHVENRGKGTGLVIIEYQDKSERFILEMNSEEKEKIENYLTSLFTLNK